MGKRLERVGEVRIIVAVLHQCDGETNGFGLDFVDGIVRKAGQILSLPFSTNAMVL